MHHHGMKLSSEISNLPRKKGYFVCTKVFARVKSNAQVLDILKEKSNSLLLLYLFHTLFFCVPSFLWKQGDFGGKWPPKEKKE